MWTIVKFDESSGYSTVFIYNSLRNNEKQSIITLYDYGDHLVKNYFSGMHY